MNFSASDREHGCGSTDPGDHLIYVQDQAARQGDVVLSYHHDGSDLIAELIKLLFENEREFSAETISKMIPVVVTQLPSLAP